jgi:probable phosphoglycerate mutase
MEPMPEMILYLIRHGETALNARRVVQPPETPLSSRGLAQARRLADRLACQGVARILSSDLTRAVQTADAVGRATGITPELEALLQERNFGDIRGTPYAELGFDLFGAAYHPPGGESWEQFEARVDRAWTWLESIATRTRGALAVVTHGLVCRSLATRHMIGEEVLEPGEIAPQRWGNTSLTVAEGPSPWRIRLLNCTAHLDAPSRDDAEAISGL